MEVKNFDRHGKPIDLSKVVLSEEKSKEILEILIPSSVKSTIL